MRKLLLILIGKFIGAQRIDEHKRLSEFLLIGKVQ